MVLVTKCNTVITVLGLIFGVLPGTVLGYAIVIAIENDTTAFIRTPSIKACCIGCGLSAIFSIIVNVIARSKIKRLQLNNINSIE